MPARPRLPAPLLVIALAAGAVALLLVVGLLVDRWPFAADRWLLLALRTPGDLSVPIGPVWLLRTMRDVTTLGDVTVLTLVVVIATGLLLAFRRWRTALLVVAATVSGSSLVSWEKLHAARARPTIVPHLVEVGNMSFPSGHATNSAIVYLTLAALSLRAVPTRAARGYVVAVAVLLVGAIGASRVYLGVHWPSDVATGWCAGTLWALAWWRLGVWWDAMVR